MKQGDILLVAYRFDPLCWLIRKGTCSNWSHTAWVLNKTDYISANGTAIRINKIKKLKNKLLYRIKAIRLKNISYKQIRKVSSILKKQQYHYNYFKFILNFFCLYFTCKRKYNIPTCSFLIASALEKENYIIKQTNLKYIVPEDFNKHKYSIDVSDEL